MALPSGYKLLEYIQSTGTQCVDTNIKPNQDTRIDIVSTPDSIEEANKGIGFIPYGAGISNNRDAFECYTSGGRFELNYDGQYAFIGTAAVGKKCVISHDKNNVTISIEGSGTVTYTFSYRSFTAPYTMTLCAINRGSYFCGLQKIYSCKIYSNTVLVRDYWPCKNASGAVGLWDDVNGVFYGNAGSGAFVAGPEVAAPDTPSELAQIPGVTLRWSPVSCEGYRIYRDGTLIGTTTETVYTDTTAELNQTYVYTVTAYRGNLESAPATLTVYTKAGYFYYAPYFTDATF